MKLEDLTVGQIVYAPHRKYGKKFWRETRILEIDMTKREVRAEQAVVHVHLRKIANAFRLGNDYQYMFPERAVAYWREAPETDWIVGL